MRVALGTAAMIVDNRRQENEGKLIAVVYDCLNAEAAIGNSKPGQDPVRKQRLTSPGT